MGCRVRRKRGGFGDDVSFFQRPLFNFRTCVGLPEHSGRVVRVDNRWLLSLRSRKFHVCGSFQPPSKHLDAELTTLVGNVRSYITNSTGFDFECAREYNHRHRQRGLVPPSLHDCCCDTLTLSLKVLHTLVSGGKHRGCLFDWNRGPGGPRHQLA